MRAVVLEGPRKFNVTEIPTPEPDGKKVLIKISTTGLCGTDLGLWAQCFMKGLVLGHEFCGTVVDPGEATNLKVGDRVTSMIFSPCGECNYCKAGKINLCEQVWWYSPGVSTTGGYSEYVLARADMVRKLPDTISDIEGALIEPATVALHGVRQAGAGPGSKVLITGAGPIGLLAAGWAKALGASYIALTEINAERLKYARETGFFTEVFNGSDEKVKEKLLEASGGGFNQVIECTGKSPAAAMAQDVLASDGILAVVGTSDPAYMIQTNPLIMKEITIKGCSTFRAEEFEMTIDYMAKKLIDFTKLVTSIIRLEEVPEYFEQLASGKSSDVKVIMKPEL